MYIDYKCIKAGFKCPLHLITHNNILLSFRDHLPKIIDCYISTKKSFRLPATALLKLANTLKKLEITYDEDLFDYDYDDNYINDKDQGNEMFISTTSMDSATFDIFRLAISALHQLEYFRYVDPEFFCSPSSSPLSTFFTMNNNNSFSSSLKHLEIELGSIEARYVERILKQCPNLLILWLMSLRAYTDTSILDTIRQYCPRSEYILFDYKGDLLYGQDLFELYVPKSPGRSHAETTTPLASQSPSIPSTSSSLKKLHINIHNTNHVIPFLNHYSDTIEEMMLSFHRDYQQSLSSVHLLNQLVSLVVTHLEYPVVLATLLPKLPSLQILEFDNSHMGDNELINALKHVNTLKELKIRNGRYAVVDHMVDLFNAYAEASTIATFNSSIKELKEANSAGNRSLSEQQLCGGGQLAHVSLIDCDFIADPVLEALGNIKTLSSVYISYMYYVTTKGINAFCEQLNLLPVLRSITLCGLDCVDDSTLSILGSSSTRRNHDSTRAITLIALYNVTKEALDRLSKKEGVSLISYGWYSY